jgi:hypothetical protein
VTKGIKSDWRCATRAGLAWVEDKRTDDGTERKRKGDPGKRGDSEVMTMD